MSFSLEFIGFVMRATSLNQKQGYIVLVYIGRDIEYDFARHTQVKNRYQSPQSCITSSWPQELRCGQLISHPANVLPQLINLIRTPCFHRDQRRGLGHHATTLESFAYGAHAQKNVRIRCFSKKEGNVLLHLHSKIYLSCMPRELLCDYSDNVILDVGDKKNAWAKVLGFCSVYS